MPQFFLPLDGPIPPRTFRLSGSEAFHLSQVLRVKPGEEVSFFDGKGGRYEGIVEAVHEDGSVSGRIVSSSQGPQAAAVVRLYQGLLKAGHWELVLEKATELGVASLTPVLTPRTVVLLREERAKAKQERWGRIVLSAAKQCQRASLPELRAAAEFRDAIRARPSGDGVVAAVAWEGLCGQTARKALGEALRRASPVSEVQLFVGPEGGFSDEEIELARATGAVIFGLGPRILRAETAALAALSIVQYELGEL